MSTKSCRRCRMGGATDDEARVNRPCAKCRRICEELCIMNNSVSSLFLAREGG